jgi:glycosyltransferase involved in cell wall biosynthesis
VSARARVSVVIPVHDAEADVEAALRSALGSDLHELEVVVVENGSTDQSAAIVANIRDPRVVTVRLRPSKGASRPRNVGIARARAPYVAFLEPDDLIKDDRLSAAVSALDRYPEAGFAFADFEHIDTSGKVIQPSAIADFPRFRTITSVPVEGDWRLIPQAQLARALLYENFIGTSGVVLRKELLTEIGPFNESTAYSEDLDLWFRLAHRCGALYSNHVGHSYRVRPGSVSDGSRARNARDRITVLRREKNRWSDREARRQLDRLMAQNFAVMGYEERNRRHRLRSIAMFAHAFATFPDVRWLRGMLGSILSQRARSRHR